MPRIAIRKLDSLTKLSAAEQAALDNLLSKVVTYEAGQDIVELGVHPTSCCVLLDGVGCRYLSLPTGQRQITAFQIAGDWIDLNSYFLETTDHAIAAIVDCRVALVAHNRMSEFMEAHPRLARLLWRESMIDSAIYREWVVNVGARNARERMAHLFCELQARMEYVELAGGDTFELPLTQAELADALGISTVHANRTLQELRAERLVVFHRRMMTFPDVDRLRQVGQFDPTYLHLHEKPPSRWQGPQPEVATAFHPS